MKLDELIKANAALAKGFAGSLTGNALRHSNIYLKAQSARLIELDKSCETRLGLIERGNKQLRESMAQVSLSTALIKTCIRQRDGLQGLVDRVKVLNEDSLKEFYEGIDSNGLMLLNDISKEIKDFEKEKKKVIAEHIESEESK